MRILQLSSPTDREDLIKNFDPQSTTWLVSDLKAKQVIQAQLFKTYDVIEETSVLRASELWRRILGQVRPDFQFIPEPLACTIIKHWLREEHSWTQTDGAVKLAFKYLSYLMPILSHDHGIVMLKEWFNQNPQAEKRWSIWLKTCEALWHKFNKEKLLVSQWASAVLLNQDLKGSWSKSLIIDLGVHLQPIESELLTNLSKHLDVTLIKAHPFWLDTSERLFKSYEGFEKLKRATEIKNEKTTIAKNNIKTKKFSSSLAEVKDAVATVRSWLEKGVETHNIAITAPKIKDYWFCLQQFLDIEGIPYQKTKTSRMHTLDPLYSWLSQLTVEVCDISGGHLETSYWSHKQNQIHYDKFKRLFTHVYDMSDLDREQLVKNYYEVEVNVNRLLQRDEFISWALKRWTFEDELLLVKVLNYFVRDCPSALKLQLKDWLNYLKYVSARSEMTIEYSSHDGIQILDLTTAEFFSGSHIYMMGLCEDNLVQSEKMSILTQDVYSIENQLGFQLNHIDNSQLEFEAKWALEGNYAEIILSCALSDFQGSILAPSKLILDRHTEHNLSVPSKTRWDELKYLDEKMQLETKNSFQPFLPKSISASAIEDYLTCPFLFASKRLFRLVDEPELDLDVDKMGTGRVLHKMLYYLLDEPLKLNWTDSEIESIIERCSAEEGLVLATPPIWSSLKQRYIQIAKKFLTAEKETRKKYPTFKTVMREQSFVGYVALSSGAIKKDQEGILLKGAIDRVDMNNKGEAVVIDYKSSKPDGSNFDSWLKKNKLQLAIYTLAIENNLSPINVNRVIGAQYYVFKNFEKVGGFLCTDTDEPLYELNDRKKNKITEKEKQSLLAEIQSVIQLSLERMKKGLFEPEPSENVDCTECRWRTVCRTNHLY